MNKTTTDITTAEPKPKRGAWRANLNMPPKAKKKSGVPRIPMAGLRFGRLIVLESAGCVDGTSLWKCQCDCGKTMTSAGHNIRQGKVKSCGCLRHEMLIERRRKRREEREATGLPLRKPRGPRNRSGNKPAYKPSKPPAESSKPAPAPAPVPALSATMVLAIAMVSSRASWTEIHEVTGHTREEVRSAQGKAPE